MERLTELFRRVGDSLVVEESLSTFDAELAKVVRYVAISVHLAEAGALRPLYAAGEGFRLLLDDEPELAGALLPVAETLRPAFNATREGLVALSVPAVRGERSVAVVSLFRDAGEPFRVEELALLEDASGKLAAAIDNARRFRRAETARARALFERLDAEISRSRRSNGRLAILDCRVEGLELYETEQDRLAAELVGGCREYDFVAVRPEGFVMVLAECGAHGLESVLERVRAVFRKERLPVRIGTARYPEEASDAEDLLAVADPAAGE